MTTASLSWGSAFLAFGPSAALLFLLVSRKAQLVIVATTSAFSFLLSALLASTIWWIFHAAGVDHPVLILLPGVISQFLFRCGFVSLYHKVERVIEVSIQRHERQQREQQASSTREESDGDDQEWTESARLRLELNDWTCGLAAGAGFGGMHAVLLYGTLLASESGNLGTLYQDSCPSIPGLLLSAYNAFLFSVLDVIWMLLTFFGMRRRMAIVERTTASGVGSYLGDSAMGGNVALLICLTAHLAASFATTPNHFEGGCAVSLPLLTMTAVVTFLSFRVCVSKIFLPPNQTRRVDHQE